VPLVAPSFEDVLAASSRIAPYAHRTPVLTSATIDALAGRRLFFKCENLQKIGAFKFRGACNAVMKVPAEAAPRGVVTHSSGNHAQALALAARLRGIPAYIVMPGTSSAVKIRAVEGYGGRITLCDPTQAEREGTAARIARETGATLIPPYDHPDIIAGQGTAALELLEDHPDLDAIIAPIGGGGLISGTCLAAHGLPPLPTREGTGVRECGKPARHVAQGSGGSTPSSPLPSPGGTANWRIRIIAAEPAGADDAARSFAGNALLPQDSPNTIADGLLTGMSELTWSIVRAHVERVVTVPEARIVEAMRLVWERMKLIIEPSSAVALAAALSDEVRVLSNLERVGVIFSGGNVDLDKLPW
jgi:threonine dehydratase/serine racemase